MYQLFGFIQRFALSKGGSTVVGLIVVCTLIWFMGPRIGLKTGSSRLMVIGIIIGVAILFLLIKRFIINRKSNAFASGLATGDSKAAQRQAEISDIKDKMGEVISSLKSSDLGFNVKGQAALYALPWYMVIGPSATGKSTMLRNSGLHFPYNRQEDLDIKGFGGTRNCDWWFSDDAVLLDTAGRYTSESDDNEEWVAFLQLLKKYRTKTPINGVIIALSMVDILTQDGLAVETHVNIIRERIEELIKHLGITFPIYIVFTKCDLLHGFNSFFQEGSKEEQEQVWGAYLLDKNLHQDNLETAVATRLNELYTRLCNLRILKLSIERNQDKKIEIFDFPEQFRYAGERLQEFINLLFKANPYQDTPAFYGFYFTSGVQEGAPIQRIVGDLHESFGFVESTPQLEDGGSNDLSAQPSKSFFIHKLFKDVIFKSRSDVYKNKRQFKVGNWLKAVWVSTAALTVIASFLLLSGSLTTNTLLLNNGSTAANELSEHLRSHDLNAHGVYLGLAQVYKQYADIVQYEKELPLHLRLGIYRADKQKLPLRKIIFDAIEVSLIKRIVKVMERNISSTTSGWDDYTGKQKAKHRAKLYQYLRTYLMLVFRDWIDVEQAAPVIAKLWIKEINRYIDSDTDKLRRKDEAEVINIVKLYLSSLKGDSLARQVKLNVNQRLISRARSKLKLVATPRNLYARIKGLGDLKYKPLQLNELLKHNKQQVLRSNMPLPGMFTATGWKEFVLPEIRKTLIVANTGDWVLDANVRKQLMAGKKLKSKKKTIDKESSKALQREIRKLYFKEYAGVWLKFVKSIYIKPFDSMEEASNKIAILDDDEGPLKEFFILVARNIHLTDHEISQPSIKKPVITASANSSKDVSAVTPVIVKRLTVRELDKNLKDLQRIFFKDSSKPSDTIADYMKALGSIRDDLEKMSASSNIGRDAQKYASNLLKSSNNNSALYSAWVRTKSNIKRLSFQTRDSVSALLFRPIKNVWRVVLDEARSRIELGWRENVIAAYRAKLHGKYPFKSTGRDSSVADVGEFFKPDTGVYWSYFNKQLKPFLEKDGSRWTSRTWLGIGVGFSDHFFKNVARTRVISKALFAHDKDQLGIKFELSPQPLTGVQKLTIKINGHEYIYKNWPVEWVKFEWPGGGTEVGASLVVEGDNKLFTEKLAHNGVWGLFRLLKRSRGSKEHGLVYSNIWRVNAIGQRMQVQYKFRAASYNNLFGRNRLENFSMPRRMFYRKKSAALKSSSLD